MKQISLHERGVGHHLRCGSGRINFSLPTHKRRALAHAPLLDSTLLPDETAITW